jgi:sigma-E factor negative regulatory protein RseA
MSDRAVDANRRQTLSALMDGDVDAAAIARACDEWRADPLLRADWHAYHLIGDVLRSADLASVPARDETFLAALRVRLAAEPVVLAPSSVRAAVVRRRRWRAPLAVAAGFCAVAGVLVATRTAVPGGDATEGVSLAQRAAAPAAAVAVVANRQPPPALVAPAPAQPAPVEASARLIRDAELDRYLDAHRQYGSGSLLFSPGAVARSANRPASQR